MPFSAFKTAKGLLWNLLGLAALANKDWSYFFPLSAHTDLRFQVVGESLALLALAGIVILMRVTGSGEGARSSTLTFRWRVLSGAFFVVLLFVMFWRDFFPNDSFSLRAGAMDFLYAPAAGLAIFAFSFLTSPTLTEPSKEREASVV